MTPQPKLRPRFKREKMDDRTTRYLLTLNRPDKRAALWIALSIERRKPPMFTHRGFTLEGSLFDA